MSLLIQYLVKLSLSLAVVWLFYQFVLRRLTFYNNNRWYLLFFSALSFFIPFINVSFTNNAADYGFVDLIPSVHQYTVALEEASHCPIPIWSTQYDKWDWTAFALMTGAAILFIRFIIRYISFVRIRNKAELISDDGVKIYQVDAEIIPFSFGNSVFINCNQHSSEELEEIVRHEFVHVKQKHTIDIVWAELLCSLNWYNPFAWLLKKSIRQNLEFIADNKVIENGINKKQYQYLLLKVIGNNQYSIATQFNFSSLKKRIAMMNKNKSAKVNMLRFLFMMPLLAILLVSFRNEIKTSFFAKKMTDIVTKSSFVYEDTVPPKAKPQADTWKELEFTGDGGESEKKFLKRHPQVKSINWGKVLSVKGETLAGYEEGDVFLMIKFTNGKSEMYNLGKSEDIAKFKKNYGEEPPVAPPPPPPAPASAPKALIANGIELSDAAEWDITDKKAVIKFNNGRTEVYDLTNAKEKKKFKEKYGEPALAISTVAPSAVDITEAAIAPSEMAAPSSVSIATTAPAPAKVNVKSRSTAAAPVAVETVSIATTAPEEAVIVSGNLSSTITGHEDILITITKNTKPAELEEFKKQMKAKGIDLVYDEIDYDNGILVKISGTMKSKTGQSNFVGNGFTKLILASVKDGDKTWFKVSVTDGKVVL